MKGTNVVPALPRITIVTPSFNQAKFIEWTVRSVLLQRYPNLEYILIDGGSTDGTMDVLAPYADRFAHISSAKDDGQSDALNRGFARSTGEIMAYLNSDDMIGPDVLRFVAHYFDEHPDVDALYSHRVIVDEDNTVVNYWVLPPHVDYLQCRWDHIPQETCFWRRRVFDRLGNIDASYRFAMDYDLFTRYMRGGARFARVKRFLGAFRWHRDAKTSRLLESIGQQEIKIVQNKYQVPIRSKEHLVGAAFSTYVSRCGARWAASGKALPGALPGIEYNYNDVWAGLLDDRRLPPIDLPEDPAPLAAEPAVDAA